MKRKIHLLLILPIIVLMLSGCHIAYIPGVADIPAHVEHEIYNKEELCEAEIVSIDNYVGNITVKKVRQWKDKGHCKACAVKESQGFRQEQG